MRNVAGSERSIATARPSSPSASNAGSSAPPRAASVLHTAPGPGMPGRIAYGDGSLNDALMRWSAGERQRNGSAGSSRSRQHLRSMRSPPLSDSGRDARSADSGTAPPRRTAFV
eukprot:3927379-Prymnesium_polylepis.1